MPSKALHVWDILQTRLSSSYKNLVVNLWALSLYFHDDEPTNTNIEFSIEYYVMLKY